MSLYQLTIEPGTKFSFLHEQGQLKTLSDEAAAALFEITQEETSAAGLVPYEVSNHAFPGHECRHNLLYWDYGEYLGIGPGAHSRLIRPDGSRHAIVMERHPETWARRVGEKGVGMCESEIVAGRDLATEYLLMGLRTSNGIDLKRLRSAAGIGLDMSTIDQFCMEGFLNFDRTNGHVSTTPRGRQVLDSLISELVVRGFRPAEAGSAGAG
jgi:oxygen-independent coproporphyrinogen-3 oxidase